MNKKFGVLADKRLGVNCLDFILSSKYTIEFIVVTSDDSSVIDLVETKYPEQRHKIINYELYNNDKALANHIHESVDFIFLIFWPYIIKKEIVELATIGVVNAHPSYLSFNRGGSSSFWALCGGFLME